MDRVGKNNKKKKSEKSEPEYVIKKNGKKRKKWSKKKKIIVSVILALVLFIGIVAGVYIIKSGGNVTDAAISLAADLVGDDTPITVLFLGVSEDIGVELTDTIMLAAYNPVSQKAFIVSIPRDTYVGTNEAYADGYDKINALWQSGVDETIEAVEKLTGVTIQYYVMVRNNAFVEIVDAIGGVEFDVPIDMDYDDPTQDLHIHLEAGLQELDGDKAEQLLRFRHNNDGTSYPTSYGDNDYGRMRTQREFLKVLANDLISWKSIANLKTLANVVFYNTETDMKLSQIIGYIPSALKFNTDDLLMAQLPGASQMINELSFYKANSSETLELMNEYMISLELSDEDFEALYTPISAKSSSSSTTTTTTTDDDDDTNTTTTTTSTTDTSSTTTTTTTDTSSSSSSTTTSSSHTHSYTKTTTAATCTATGKYTYICSSCGDYYEETIPATGHSYSVTSSTDATCTESGSKTYTCSSCGDNYTETVAATGHSYSVTVSASATCTTDGYTTYTCSVCGDTYTDTISATGHTPVDGFCSVCGEAVSE